jgi:hypothetical protein
MKEKMSYGNINKSTVYDVERKFEHFQNNYEHIVSKNAFRYPEITITSSHDSKKKLRRCRIGSRKPYGGVGGGGLAS